MSWIIMTLQANKYDKSLGQHSILCNLMVHKDREQIPFVEAAVLFVMDWVLIFQAFLSYSFLKLSVKIYWI